MKKYLLLSLFFFQIAIPIAEKPFVIIIPSYNNGQWVDKNLSSAFNQKYNNFRIVYINDCSTDDTEQKVIEFIDNNKAWDKITLFSNETNQGAMANWYKAIHLCDDDEIVVNLDGDDWLANDQVLQKINAIYSNEDVWLTYGQYQSWPHGFVGICRQLPDIIIEHRAYRRYPYFTSHLRTYYAWLFKKIKKEDLIYNDEFLPVACDVGFMLPMMEMVGNRFKFVKDILYIYNMSNPLNDHKIKAKQMKDVREYIQSKKPYPLIQAYNPKQENV